MRRRGVGRGSALTVVRSGGKRISKRWGTRVMDNDKGELTACMVNIELPGFPVPADGTDQFKIYHFIENCLLNDYDTFAAPVSTTASGLSRQACVFY